MIKTEHRIMLDPKLSLFGQLFFEELKKAIVVLCEEINQTNDGNLQDGFCTRTIEDGWLSYKGVSCGFALHLQPTFICMTFGPDSPFVGYTNKLFPLIKGSELIWMDENGRMRFTTPKEMARYAVETLAAKVHDRLPTMPKLLAEDSSSQAHL